MDLGSLFSGFGSPPPPDPPVTNYNTIIIIAIALAIIVFFGNTPLNAGNLGFRGPMYPPPGHGGEHHCHYDKYEFTPYPDQGVFRFQGNQWIIVAAIVVFAFLLFPRRVPAPPV